MIALALSLLAGWQPAEVVVNDRLSTPVLSAAADGTLHFAGGQSLGPVEAPEFRYGVRTAPPGAAFGPELPLETAGFEAVAAGVDAAGRTTVLFERDGRLAVGMPPAALSTRRASARTLAVAPGGAAIAAWVERSGRAWHVAAAVRETDTFGPVQVIGPATRETRLQAAIGSRGDAVLAWTDASEYGKPGFAAMRRPGGPFGTPGQVARRTADLLPAVGEDGTILLALSRLKQLDVRVFRNRLSRPQTIACNDGLQAATVASDGRALVLCKRKRLETWEGRLHLRRTARLPTGSLFGPAEVDLAADGSALVTWSRSAPGFYASGRVMAALRSGRGAFATPVAITEDFPAVEPVAAKLLNGGAVVIAETFGEDGRSILAIRHVA
jgi:hypothetical protein